MGYYTSYSLSIINNPSNGRDLIEELRKENKDAAYAIDDIGSMQQPIKWYDYDKDMRAFSKKFPGIIFLLEGIGEEQPDMWKAWFMNGKMFRAEAVITYPDFNPDLLD